MKLAKILTYSGTLPLVVCVALIFSPIAGVDSHRVAVTYSAIILSFLCGIHWAAFLFFAEKCPRHLLITSNVVALLAWCSLLVTYQEIVFIFQACVFSSCCCWISSSVTQACCPSGFITCAETRRSLSYHP